MTPIQIYLGVPQTVKIPVYEAQQGYRTTIKQMIFSNTDAADAKITVTLNTVDIMKDFVVKTGETQIINVTVVLNQNDRLSLQQEKQNAINVMISGDTELITTSY
ncbi:hypothetical protein ACE41I_17345 [Bacillus cereus]